MTCSGHGVCQEATGTCICDLGYEQPTGNAASCVDVDECAIGNGGCDPLTACVNLDGGRACTACPPGYSGTGATGCVPDECVGAPDPACACVRVAPDGDDITAAQNGGATPFASVQVAVDFAYTHPNVARKVCVAGGASCDDSATYAGPAAIDFTMRDGISVYGSYESAGWTQCSALTTTLAPGSATGVLFGDDIETETVLDHFVILRFDAEATTGVTVAGAMGVELSSLRLTTASNPVDATGVDILGGAEVDMQGVQLFADSVGGGTFAATGLSVGVSCLASRVSIAQSTFLVLAGADAPATALVLEDCSDSTVIGSTFTAAAGADPSIAVLTGAHIQGGSVIQLSTSTFTASVSDDIAVTAVGLNALAVDGLALSLTTVGAESSTEAIGLRAADSEFNVSGTTRARGHLTAIGMDLDASWGSIDGEIQLSGNRVVTGVDVSAGEGIVFRGTVTGGGASATGIRFQACGGAAPLVTEALLALRANGLTQSLNGILAAGDCHPRIEDTTIDLRGTNAGTVTGIGCSTAGGVTSRCTLVGNHLAIDNARTVAGVSTVTGIACDDCEEISANGFGGLTHSIQTADRTARETTAGIVSLGVGTLIAQNVVRGGCGDRVVGMRATGRIENNVLAGGSGCGLKMLVDGSGPLDSTGLHALPGADVHSNTIDAGTAVSEPVLTCTSTAVLGGGAIFRNNILRAGPCSPYAFSEVSDTGAAQGRPAIFENNCLLGTYFLGPGQGSLTAEELDGLAGMTASGNTSSGCGAAHGANNVCSSVDCSGHGTCSLNSEGEASCTCYSGFIQRPGSQLICDDIDECAVENGGCDPLTACVNLEGTHTCGDCPAGYSGTGATGCFSGCGTNHGGCDPLVSCTDTGSGPSCGACPAGYTGTGESGCVPIEYCEPNPCQQGGTCFEFEDGYACDCPSGTFGSDCEQRFTNMVAGTNVTCGLLTDGTLKCWGMNLYDLAKPPPGTFKGLALSYHGCAIRDDDTLTCWGVNLGGQALAPSGSFKAVTVGEWHSCAIRDDDTVACWGGSDSAHTTPPPGTFKALALGESHTCGLRSDDTLACWGTNFSGMSDPPEGTFRALAVGRSHGCALKMDGSIQCWGFNGQGQTNAPPGSYASLAAAGHRTCALSDTGSIACWGVVNEAPPSGTFTAISLGLVHACGQRTSGDFECWGENEFSQAMLPARAFGAVGQSSAIHLDGTLASWLSSASGAVPSGNFEKLARGTGIPCALAFDGSVTCWGNSANPVQSDAPIGAFDQVASGYAHACGIRPSGALECWGDNAFGQAVDLPGPFLGVAVTAAETCAVYPDATAECWGYNGSPHEPAGPFMLIEGGPSTMCGIRPDGSVTCWDDNTNGQGTPPTGSFTGLAVDTYHACGIRPDRSVECWGQNDYGELNAPDEEFVAIHTGTNYTCGVTAARDLRCWGLVAR